MNKSLFKLLYLIHISTGEELNVESIKWLDQASLVKEMIEEDNTLLDQNTPSPKGSSLVMASILSYKKVASQPLKEIPTEALLECR